VDKISLKRKMNCSESILPSVQKIYDVYERLWGMYNVQFEIGNQRLVFPVVSENLLKEICKNVTEIFRSEPILLRIDKECVILGDLHGHIIDLLRILEKFGSPKTTTYVVLGDVVDRGEFSLETITLLFVMKLLFPNNVYLIRGNHEFHTMFQYNGFAQQIDDIYGNHILTYLFGTVFSYLPLGAIIYSKILCIHGGIGKGFISIKQLEEVQRPIIVYDTDPVMSVVWSDPNPTLNESFAQSTRGIGFHFGKKALDEFMEKENLSLLVRGHEPCQEGFYYMFNEKLITIFSASNYCNKLSNNSAVLCVTNKGSKWKEHIFPPLQYVLRNQVAFSTKDYEVYHTSVQNKTQPKNLPILQNPNIIKNDDLPTGRRAISNLRQNSLSIRKIGFIQSQPEIFPVTAPAVNRDTKNSPLRKSSHNRIKKLL
jgi:hypothetical protein